MSRSIPKALRKKIQKQIPSVRCRGHLTDGTPCPNWARVGSPVCNRHGGKSPQALRAAAKRVAIAEAIVDFDKVQVRTPWDVLEDIAHTADVLYRHAKVATNGKPYSPADLDVLKEAMSRAANMSKLNLDVRGSERRIALKEAQVTQMHGMFVRIITALELTPHQQALLPALLQREREAVTPKVIEAEAA